MKRGSHHSPEARQRMSEAHQGKKLSKEHRQRMGQDQRGEKNHNWGGGRRKTSQGYIRIYKPDHPHVAARDTVFEHRLVMEEHLGRYLEPHEFVHHKNGIRDDNRLENLELVTQRNHRGEACCPQCGYVYQIR